MSAAPIGTQPPASSGMAVAPTTRRKAKLLDLLREALRFRHYSRSTEQGYCHWIMTTMFCARVLNTGASDVRSPVDDR
jgi:hypothetical protein